MAQVTKHDSEEEREGDNSENSRVYFFMHGDTISIDDLLENFSKFIRFDISGRFYGVVFEPLKVSRPESSKVSSELLLFLARAPEIPYVHSFALLHQINAVIDGLFLGNKPFVDLQTTGALLTPSVSWDLTYLYKVVLQLLFGCHSQMFRFLNVSFDLLNLLINLIKRRQIKSLTHK